MNRQKTRPESANGGVQVGPTQMMPDYGKSVKLWYSYVMSNLFTILLAPIFVIVAVRLTQMGYHDLHELYLRLQYNLVTFVVIASGVVCGSTVYLMARPRSVYLLEHSCYKPPVHLKVSHDKFLGNCRLTGDFHESSLDFQKKILERSGLGDETYLPETMFCLPSMATAREDAEQVMFGSLDNLFASTTGVRAKDIGILVVNCSLFNPTPSLTSMIINKYKLRSNILSFNLGGMGCSAGVIAIDLAKDMLQLHRNTYALVISTEILTMNGYFGDNKSMLMTNCLFRVGSAAVLLSNKPSDRRQAKYKLIHVVRTHCGADDRAFNCVCQMQDDKGKTGVSLSKDLMTIAGKALKMNITTLGPLVLPLSEQLLYFASVIASRLYNNRFRPYIPDFKLAFEHFCIHAGGRGVIDEFEKSLQLSPAQVEASRMTLHRFGNTSSSTIWYELAYTEAKQQMRKGNRVWQIAFGSGFKCNSVVWQAIRDVKPSDHNPWLDCIYRYPVEILD